MLVTFEGQVGVDLDYKMVEHIGNFSQHDVIVEDLITGQVFKGKVLSIECENEIPYGKFIGRSRIVIVVRDPVVIEVKT